MLVKRRFDNNVTGKIIQFIHYSIFFFIKRNEQQLQNTHIFIK